ncbi:MAG: thiamine phosphate synthase [Fibrobacterota bacterium]
MTGAPGIVWLAQTERSSRGWRGHAELAREDIASGAQGILLYERNFTQEELIEEALKVKAVCDEARVPLWIRNHVVAAFVASAAGVVVTLTDLAEARRVMAGVGWVAVEAKSAEERETAFRAGAERVLVLGKKMDSGDCLVLSSTAKVYACMTSEKNS